MAKRERLPFLGRIPLEPELVTLLDAAETGGEDRGFTVVEKYGKTSSAKLFAAIAGKVVEIISEVEGK